MKLKNQLIVVSDIEKSATFYKTVLGLHVIMDFGANNAEIYFEEDNFDVFIKRLETLDIQYIHTAKEHPWGQRVVRFYDPDKHIIEVGENMKSVCKRFLDSGMTPEQISKRMDVPMKFVNGCLK